MERRSRVILACVGIVGIFLVVQIGALAITEPFSQEGHQAVEDTSDPRLSLVYVVAIVAVTGLMLAAFKLGGQAVLRVVIIFAGAYIGLFVFDVFLPAIVTVPVGGVAVNVLAVCASIGLAAVLYLYPEWYVIDAAGIVMGIGAAGLFGINFGVLPAVVLLVVLAIYDAISVYGTEHMLTLASGAMDMRVPVVLIMPVSFPYSFLDEGTPDSLDDEEADDGEEETGENAALDADDLQAMDSTAIADLSDEQLSDLDGDIFDELDDERAAALRERLPDRQALFIGLGDAVIPSVLVVSVAFFVDAGPEIPLGITSAPLPAVTAMGGTIAGLLALLWLVLKGRAHAGLPLLNGGTIAGYLAGALVSGLTLVEALGLTGVL